MFIKYLLIFLAIVLIGGFAYYYYTIQKFKNFLKFEQELKKNPSDEKVYQYMQLFNKTYIPKNPKIQASRGKVYHVIKASQDVSYETKKELRHFFESKNIPVLTTFKEIKEQNDENINEED